MQRTSPRAAFTLIEMVTVVAILLLLAGLLVGVSSVANSNAAARKAATQIKALEGVIQAYKIDNGGVPQSPETDLLDPRLHFSPDGGNSASYYQNASLFLYQALSGDFQPAGAPDGKPEPGVQHYYTFPAESLSVARSAGAITRVYFIQDPFGKSYGYSTAGLRLEAEYRKALKNDPNAARPTDQKGFNTETCDLWSTSGASTQGGQGKWMKNWGG
jgi:prepilin-type N-terminal cleavage/methylation domain-containing protein